MVQWNGKQDVIWLILVFFGLPIIAMTSAILIPLFHQNPILCVILAVMFFVIGFIIIWKRAGEKDKRE